MFLRSTRRPAAAPSALNVSGYGERTLPPTTASASEPADQPKSVSWVMFCPPLTEEKRPLAVLPDPPLPPPLWQWLCVVAVIAMGVAIWWRWR
jgi:hypothetical protein